jgi:hypothetical protein
MYIKRNIFTTLQDHQNNKKITILTGARQVGKTTLLSKLYNTLKSHHPSLFLDLDLYSNYEKAGTYEKWRQKLLHQQLQSDRTQS